MILKTWSPKTHVMFLHVIIDIVTEHKNLDDPGKLKKLKKTGKSNGETVETGRKQSHSKTMAQQLIGNKI